MLMAPRSRGFDALLVWSLVLTISLNVFASTDVGNREAKVAKPATGTSEAVTPGADWKEFPIDLPLGEDGDGDGNATDIVVGVGVGVGVGVPLPENGTLSVEDSNGTVVVVSVRLDKAKEGSNEDGTPAPVPDIHRDGGSTTPLPMKKESKAAGTGDRGKESDGSTLLAKPETGTSEAVTPGADWKEFPIDLPLGEDGDGDGNATDIVVGVGVGVPLPENGTLSVEDSNGTVVVVSGPLDKSNEASDENGTPVPVPNIRGDGGSTTPLPMKKESKAAGTGDRGKMSAGSTLLAKPETGTSEAVTPGADWKEFPIDLPLGEDGDGDGNATDVVVGVGVGVPLPENGTLSVEDSNGTVVVVTGPLNKSDEGSDGNGTPVPVPNIRSDGEITTPLPVQRASSPSALKDGVPIPAPQTTSLPDSTDRPNSRRLLRGHIA